MLDLSDQNNMYFTVHISKMTNVWKSVIGKKLIWTKISTACFISPRSFWLLFAHFPSPLTFNIFFFFSGTTGQFFQKLDKNHPWKKGIQNCSNKTPRSFPRENNNKREKIYWRNFKIFFHENNRANLN